MGTRKCFHHTSMYEGKPVVLTWEGCEADSYKVERRCGSAFDDSATWADIETEELCWNDVEDMSWEEFEAVRAITTVYEGANGDYTLADKETTWESLSSTFQSWEELENANATWEELEGPLNGVHMTWHGMEFNFPSWQYLEDKNVTWEELKTVTADDNVLKSGHIATKDVLPTDFDKVSYRVIARKAGEETHICCEENITIKRAIPSDAKITFQIPKLVECDTVEIGWSTVKNATRYRLEVLFNKVFQEPYNGYTFEDLENEYQTWESIEETTWEDLETRTPNTVVYEGVYTSFVLKIPSGARTAVFRVTAFNDFQNTKFFYSGVIEVETLFSRTARIVKRTEVGRDLYVPIYAKDIRKIPPYRFWVKYNADDIKLVDFAGHKQNTVVSPGKVPETVLDLIENNRGEIIYIFPKEAPNGKAWTGLVTLLKFKANKTTNTTIEIK